VPKMPPPPQPMPRLPKEPAPEMIRTFGPRPSPDEAQSSAPSEAAPIASPSPSAYREKNPYQAPPTEYKPPSLLREHRRLAILFAGVAAAFAVYSLKLQHRAPSAVPAQRSAVARPAVTHPAEQPSSAVQPIYIESVPDKDSH
jgi:hypothetical protein